MNMIEKDHAPLSLRSQCKLLKLHRSGLYYNPKQKNDETTLANEVYELWRRWPIYGYRRITQVLKRKDYNVNHKRIARIMDTMGIKALYPKKNTSLKCKQNKVYPYLLRALKIERKDQVWSTDSTYIKLENGFVYLVALIDVYSRRIVAWELSNCLDTEFCINMMKQAIKRAVPEIVNSDQGVQFTSNAWTGLLKENGIKISMDGVGRCLDNIFIERFWRSLKYEDTYLKPYESMLEARSSIAAYIKFYNNERLHSSLGYKTPSEVYFAPTQQAEGCVGVLRGISASQSPLLLS